MALIAEVLAKGFVVTMCTIGLLIIVALIIFGIVIAWKEILILAVISAIVGVVVVTKERRK